jgi:nucleoside-diphosphate-sugar epimerase
MTSERIALVLGATGGIGAEIARALHASGWQVRALHRNPAALEAAGRLDSRFAWLRGDAMSREDVLAAANGVALIVHAVNPPGYRNWQTLVLPMIDNTIAAARKSGARIVLPGTVYNYGPDAFPVLTERSAQRPGTRKGALRVELERRLEAAAAEGVRSLIVRAGDFFGPSGHGNSWLSGAMIKPGSAVRSVIYPGRRGVGHQWAYMPDVAQTILRLLDRDARLPAFATYHMRGHWDEDGTMMVAALGRASGRDTIKVRAFPWPLVWLLQPFSTLFREMQEMRYLWREPIRMDNARLVAALDAEPHTPWDEAVRTTLAALRCI